MFVRIHRNERDTILAACDEGLVGRTFKEGNKRLDVSEIFYKGQAVDRDALVAMMKDASIMNLVGEEVISVAVEEGYVSEDSIIVIDGVRHAQVVLL